MNDTINNTNNEYPCAILRLQSQICLGITVENVQGIRPLRILPKDGSQRWGQDLLSVKSRDIVCKYIIPRKMLARIVNLS